MFLITLRRITRPTLQFIRRLKSQSPSDTSYSVPLDALDQVGILGNYISVETYSENSDICLGGFTFEADSFAEDFLHARIDLQLISDYRNNCSTNYCLVAERENYNVSSLMKLSTRLILRKLIQRIFTRRIDRFSLVWEAFRYSWCAQVISVL